MGLRPAKSHEKLSGRRLADEILWGRLVTCGRLAIGPCRLRGGPAAVTNRRAGCQPAPHWFFDPVNTVIPGILSQLLRRLNRLVIGVAPGHTCLPGSAPSSGRECTTKEYLRSGDGFRAQFPV